MVQVDESKRNNLTSALRLAQRHAQEWKTILQFEIRTRHAIADRHRKELIDLVSVSQAHRTLDRSKLLLKHIGELTQLKCSNTIKRHALLERQGQEKASLNETGLPIS